MSDAANGQPLLRLAGLEAFYGESRALAGVDLSIFRGEVVTLLGRNGAGKTTTLKSIIGLMRRRSGVIEFAGRDIIGMLPEQIARLGVAFCPEDRGIFASLTVFENLMLPPVIRPGGMTVAEIYALFPNISERAASQGTQLSGGEQQMLAIGRILRTGANLLLLDEPTEGLAPTLVKQIGDAIRALKTKGFTVLLVEQNARFAAAVADRHYVMEEGRIVDCITAEDIDTRASDLQEYLGV